MRFLSALLIGLGIVAAIVLLTPILTLGLALAVVFGCFFIWLLPILLIAGSDRTTTGEKVAWILAIIFLSWFAWVFYVLLAPIKAPRDRYYDDRYYGDRYYRSRYDY